MPDEHRISRELSIGELLSQTWGCLRRDFLSFFMVFAVVGVILGVLTTVAGYLINVPKLPASPTQSQLLSYESAELSLVLVAVVLALVIVPVAAGTAVKMASDSIEGRRVDVRGDVKLAASKLLRLWALELLVGVIVFLGVIALVVPGVILAIMFSLAVPVLMIENMGVRESMGRSRKLVAKRWLKTFAFLLILGVAIAILTLIASFVGALFGPGRTIAAELISALYTPLSVIGVTVLYYSNVARLASADSAPQQVLAQPTPSQPVTKLCPNCGGQISLAAIYCSKCGAKQPA